MIITKRKKMNAQPTRIQRSRQKGHRQTSPNRLPIVYVGRGTQWGNPFRIVKYPDGKFAIKTNTEYCAKILIKHGHAVYDTKQEAQADAVRLYKVYLLPYEHGGDVSDFFISNTNLHAVQRDLKGKNLSCWCKFGEPCHADFLIEIANR